MTENQSIMKKIFALVLALICATISFSQGYPLTQTIGSDSTIVVSKGALQSRLINLTFVDTSAANNQRIRQYAGAQIVTTTGGIKLWLRNQTATAWLQIPAGSGVGNIYTTDGTVTGNRILTGAGFPLTFTQLGKFVVSADSLRYVAGSQALIITGDTASLSRRLSYGENLGSTFTKYSVVDKNYVDSAITSSPAGTVTSVNTNNNTGITGGPITSTGTLAIDTLLISTRAWRQKGIDSVSTLINTNINGTLNFVPKFTGTHSIGNSNLSDTSGILLYKGSGFRGLTLRSPNDATSIRLEAYSDSLTADKGIKEMEMDGYYSSYNSYFGFNSSGGEWRMMGHADNPSVSSYYRGKTEWWIPSKDGTYGSFDIAPYYNTSNTLFTVKANGLVGVGTTSLDSNFTVANGTWLKGGLRASGLPSAPGTKQLRIDASGNISYTDTLIDAGGTVTSVATNNGTGITGGTITTSGTLSIDTTVISTRLWRQKGIDSVAALINSNVSGTTNRVSKFTGTNTIGNSSIADSSSSVAMTILSSGNIGIGTSSPTQKLDVNGDASINTVRVGLGAGGISTNTVLGNGALNSNTTGYYNSAIGNVALNKNTTGYYNVATGLEALYFNTTGQRNVATGSSSLFANTTGLLNTAVGHEALMRNTSGYSNVALGALAGAYTNLGNNNQSSVNSTYLGYNTTASTDGNDNEIVIGNNAQGNGSNSVTLGNSSITKTVLRENVGIGTVSPDSALTVVNGAYFQRGIRASGLPAAPGTKALRINASGTISIADTLIDAGGTVTSVATNNGTGITGGTITTSGTLAIDTTVISTRAWRQKGIDSVQGNLTSGLALKVNISDTASMLSPYLRKADTTSLSNRINLKVNISDTSSMLGNYINNVGYGLARTGQVVRADSATLSNYYLRRKDSLTATNLLGYVTKQVLADTASAIRGADAGGTVKSVATNTATGITGGTITTSGTLAIDTLLISTRAWRQKGVDSLQANINGKVNISDTATMLSPYLRSNVASATYVPQTRTITINGTSQDLSANRTYNVGTVTSVATSTGTGITGGTITSSGTIAADTTLLSTRLWRQKGVDSVQGNLTSGLALKVNISDTSSMLSPYLRKVDTASLSNRINLKVNISDTSSMLSPYFRTAGIGLKSTGQTVYADTLLLSTRAWRQKGIDSVAALVSGAVSGTTNYIPKFTGTSTIGNSLIRDDGSGVSIGITPQTDKLFIYNSGGSNNALTIQQDGTGDIIRLNGNSGANRLVLQQGGNLGLGVTPSAWGSGYTALQMNNGWLANTNAGGFIGVLQNAYYNGSSYIYGGTGAASSYYQQNGEHIWLQAASGTAGNAISFTQAMTLFSTGNLAVGGTSDAGYKLDITGTGRFTGTTYLSTSSGVASISNTSPTTLWQGQFLQISNDLILGRLSANGYSYWGHNVAFNGSAFKSINGGTGALIGLSGAGGFNIDFASGAAAAGDTYTTYDTKFSLTTTGAATFSSGIATNGYTASTSYAALFNGSVGIGTTSPNEKLIVYGTSSSRPTLLVGPLTTRTVLYSTYNSQDNPAIEVNTSTTNGFAGLTMSNSDNTSGNTLGGISFVAAGTSASEKRGVLINSALEASSSSNVTANLQFYTNNAGTISEKLRITSGGNVNIGGNYTSTTNTLQVTGNAAIGYTSAAPSSGLIVAGNTVIGSSTDAGYKLDVNGTGRFSGALTMAANSKVEGSGAPNFVLSSTSAAGSGVGPYQTFKTNSSDFGYIGSEDALMSTTGNRLALLGLNGLSFRTGASYVERLSLASTGAATFSSSVTATGYLLTGDGTLKLNSIASVQSQQIQYQNNGTNKWQLYLNTADNSYNIYNSTNSANRLTILESGSVGIGTTSPSMKLHIDGISGLPATSGTSQNGELRLTSTGDYTMDMGIDNSSGKGWIQVGNKANLSGSFAGPLLLNPNGGNVGIGVTAPNNKLVLPNASYLAWVSTGGSESIAISGNSGNALEFYNGGERMRITPVVAGDGGEVLINTTTDAGNYKLQVANALGDAIYAAGGIETTQTLKTGTVNGNNPKWKLGAYGTAIAGSNGYSVAVDIDGTIYYLMTGAPPEPDPEAQAGPSGGYKQRFEEPVIKLKTESQKVKDLEKEVAELKEMMKKMMKK